MASFFKCWSQLFYAICRQIFNFNNKQQKFECDPCFRQVVFFCFCFFFPYVSFCCCFFFSDLQQRSKKVSSGQDSSPQKLYRHMFLENVLSALFTFTFPQHSFIQYVWYSHSPLVKTHHVKEYSPALNRTQISEIRH